MFKNFFLDSQLAFCHLANPGPRVGPVTCTPSRPAAAEEKKEMPIKTDAAAMFFSLLSVPLVG